MHCLLWVGHRLKNQQIFLVLPRRLFQMLALQSQHREVDLHLKLGNLATQARMLPLKRSTTSRNESKATLLERLKNMAETTTPKVLMMSAPQKHKEKEEEEEEEEEKEDREEEEQHHKQNQRRKAKSQSRVSHQRSAREARQAATHRQAQSPNLRW